VSDEQVRSPEGGRKAGVGDMMVLKRLLHGAHAVTVFTADDLMRCASIHGKPTL